jgi:competence protein ComFA
VDSAYWADKADLLVRFRECVPLGMAETLCSSMNSVWLKKGDNPRNADEMWARPFEELVAKAAADAKLEQAACNPGSGGGEKSIAPDLKAAARFAAQQLAGRSLLQDEVLQLLDTLPLSGQGVAPLAAVQLASLMGAVQLTAAVAPKPAAPPLRGLRLWAKRLRPARLLRGRASLRPQELRCRRCGSGQDRQRRTLCAACGQACAYCEACLGMGRSRECGLLVIGVPAVGGWTEERGSASLTEPLHALTLAPAAVRPDRSDVRSAGPAHALERPARPTAPLAYAASEATGAGRPASALPSSPEELIARWGLSPAQGDAAAQALAFLQSPAVPDKPINRSFLLWAVTGAGKTEMIFPLLEAVLAKGGRALVATPRRDVVLELAPRLAKAFPNDCRAVLYGGSPERWAIGALTLATTHQLLRFQGAFDLVLIDELDAFPYHNDPMLHFAADKCRKAGGKTVLLSATPPQELQRGAAKGRLAYARVPVRYHRHPQPVPRRLKLPSVYHMLRRRSLPASLLAVLHRSVARGAQVFLFVPYVKQVEPLVGLLRSCAGRLSLAPESISGTSSKDIDRGGKVVSFRSRSTRLLVTTTILERGVTIPKSDVFILDADNPMFDAASLVQMAGRAGRSGDDPFGYASFGAPTWTAAQKGSIRQIRAMNALARRKGYFNFS